MTKLLFLRTDFDLHPLIGAFVENTDVVTQEVDLQRMRWGEPEIVSAEKQPASLPLQASPSGP